MKNLDPCGDVNELTIEIMRLFGTVELVKLHMELTCEILQTETKEQVMELKQKYSSINIGYEKIQSKEDITPVAAKSGIAFIYKKMFLEMKKVLKQCFNKGVHGEIQIVKTEENIGRIQIMVRFSFL